MKKLLAAASLAASTMLVAGPASSAVLFSFDPGDPSPSAGFVVIDDFDDASGISGGVNYEIKTPPADGNGAPPANSVPSGTSYLSVKGGGFATIDFAAAVGRFQFDWGSIDTYNTLTIYKQGGGSLVVVPGGNFPNLANGNQALPGTNGLFTVFGDAGERFTGIRLDSSQNSFEIDNLAVAVPEPATWGMMILGFAGMGAVIRRRRHPAAPQVA
ncbi:PEPxxWA-CTERM sorting domain-containing protein [Phenylobacterium sp.]|uniref:Npun_F0296 family exosortase-dependent surface protein n=1 Tax=Phenylobacterium sp. TaxID=1871053 RepID=UPI002EDADD93